MLASSVPVPVYVPPFGATSRPETPESLFLLKVNARQLPESLPRQNIFVHTLRVVMVVQNSSVTLSDGSLFAPRLM